MSKNVKITIPTGYLKELQNYGNQIAKNLAINFRNELVKEYRTSIELFYASYTPQTYNRHWQLRKSFRPYYRNAHGTRFHGGVEITSDSMDNVYHDTISEVLSTSLSGYHGRTSLGIYTAPEIYTHMLQYRDLLFNSAESFVDQVTNASSGLYGNYDF